MSINLDPAREFNKYMRKFSVEDLIPPLINRKPSKSQIFQTQLCWFLYEVRTPGTPQHIEYGQTKTTQLPLAVFGAVIDQKNEVAGRQLRLLDHGINGIVRTADNCPVEIPHLNAHEVRRLMSVRLHYENGASVAAHRADSIGETTEVSPVLKRRLMKAIQYVLDAQKATARKISAGFDSERELRVNAELFWELDVLYHELAMEVAGWLHGPTHVRNLRAKMRLVGGYKDVVLRWVDTAIEEHEQIADALLSLCDDKRDTEERLVRSILHHLERAECELLSILQTNYPDFFFDTPHYETPRLDAICAIAE